MYSAGINTINNLLAWCTGNISRLNELLIAIDISRIQPVVGIAIIIS
jgi:hypothetical protein